MILKYFKASVNLSDIVSIAVNKHAPGQPILEFYLRDRVEPIRILDFDNEMVEIEYDNANELWGNFLDVKVREAGDAMDSSLVTTSRKV